MGDPFLTSMTFATHEFRAGSIGCDCDECGVNVHIPGPILAALRERKRRKLEERPLKRTQHRSLIRRGPDSVAAWHWILPQGAEPLVEFGSSHRIVYVERLPENGTLRSIGRGIIGSKDEEDSRRDIDWKEGAFYFVPSNGGKALGWIHHVTATDDKNTSPSAGHAELKIAKVILDDKPKDVRFSDDTEEEYRPKWVGTFTNLSKKAFQEQRKSSNHLYYRFDENDAKLLKEAFSQASTPEMESLRGIDVIRIPEPAKNTVDTSAEHQGNDVVEVASS